MFKRSWIAIAGCLLCCLLAVSLFATPPRLISYQGRVTDNLGAPLNQAGASVRFLIYKDSTGGSFSWAEVTTKDIVDGLFDHVMGSLVPLPDSLFTNYDALFLEILVNGSPIIPRTRLVGSPRTASIHGSAGGTVTSDVLIQTASNGNSLEANQTGLGRAGRFSIDNALNGSDALVAVTQGGGSAGSFLSEGSGPVLQATSNGNGYSVYAQFGLGMLSSVNGSGDSSNAIKGLIISPAAGSYSAAVRGQNLGTGFTGIGVWGSHSGSGWGIYGVADGVLGHGVRGSSASGVAIGGYTTSGIAGAFDGGRVTVTDATDASLGGGASGYLVLGATNGVNMVLDNNELIARDNGAVSPLHLQAEGGAVAIGAQALTLPAGYILVVDGKAIMEEVEVQLSQNWPDYVFDENYQMLSVEELEAHVKSEKHLPGIPPAAEVEAEGLALGEMQSKLLEKVEELTLYIIDLNRQLASLKAEKTELESRIGSLESRQQNLPKESGL